MLFRLYYMDSSLTFCVDICLESDLSPPLVSGRCMMPMHSCHGGDLIAKTNTINIEMRKNCCMGKGSKYLFSDGKKYLHLPSTMLRTIM